MWAAEFLHANDSADPFLKQNMRYGICRHCEIFTDCNKTDAMPIISPISSYIFKFYNEHSRGFNTYPQSGGWDQQPIWFIDLLDKLRAKMGKLDEEKRKREELKAKNGNK